METNNKRLTYGICILALSALLLTWISHSGHKAEAPKEAPIPWKGVDISQAAPAAKQEAPAEVSSSSGTSDAGHSSTQPPARPASPSPAPPSDAASSSSSLPSYFSTPSYDEGGAPADSDVGSTPPQETAAQRVGRQLRRH